MPEKSKWYLPASEKGAEPLGPFELKDIKQKLKAGQLSWDDFVWSSFLEHERWYRLIEIVEFHSLMSDKPNCSLPKRRSEGRSAQVKNVSIVHKGKGEYGEENEYRRFPRAPFKTICLINNDHVYCEATTQDISEKGLFLTVNRPDLFETGEEITITIIDHPILGTCSIPSVIIKTWRQGASQDFGIYFLRLNPKLRQKVAQYVVEMLEVDQRETA